MGQATIHVIKRAGLLSAGLLLLLFVTVVHSNVRPMQAHAMSGTGHHNSSTANTDCATLCMVAAFKDDERNYVEQDRQDKLEPTPFLPTFDRAYFENLYNFTCDNPAPPLKIPIYKLCMVFRR